MARGRLLTDDNEIRDVLRAARTVAVIGMSPKSNRDSHRVGGYLMKRGYTVFPVRPAQTEILGTRAYGRVTEIDGPVDIIDVFRRADQIMSHVEEALTVRPAVFWMQLGIEHPEAAELLIAAGIDVISNRCIKIEYERLIGR